MKILVVLPRFPYPLEKGDKLRAFNQIKELSKHNDVYLYCVSHKPVLLEHEAAVKPYCKEICYVDSPLVSNIWHTVKNFCSTKSLQMGWWDSSKSRKTYKDFESRVKPDVIFNQMVRTMPLVSRSKYPKVMDFQDAMSMNMERRMDFSKSFIWRHILHFEFKMLRSTEYNAFLFYDALTVISEPDADAIPQPKKEGDKLHIVPNGVDMDFFCPMEREKKYDIVFCGNMSYEPNVRASKYLVEKVMPLVWQRIPEARVMLAGANPKDSVRELAGDRVTVTGTVEDIRECYASAKVFAAPMQTGSGLQNKLLEAMSMQIPCVTTSIANDSLHAEDGKQVMVGDTAEMFAEHLVNLLQNENAREELAKSGYAYVRDNFSWERECAKLEEILKSVAKK